MTIIYLIRHGQASFGAENYDQLSANGELQAQLLGHYLHEILQETPFVVSGAMQRHQQTAALSLALDFPDAEVNIDPRWNEFNHQEVFAKFEPRFKQPHLLKQNLIQHTDSRAYLAQIFTAAIERWTSTQHEHEYEESWPAFRARVEAGLASLCGELVAKKPPYALVYSSGGVISVIVGKLLGLSVEKTFALNWAIANTSLTTLRLVDGEAELLSFNEHQFIKAQEESLLTWI